MNNVTGNYRFRCEGDILILQIEEENETDHPEYKTVYSWRDAKVEDLLDVNFSYKSKPCAAI